MRCIDFEGKNTRGWSSNHRQLVDLSKLGTGRGN